MSIELGSGTVAFARLLIPPLFEFFNFAGVVGDPTEVEAVVGSGVLFRVDVMNSAIESGRWPVVGGLPLSTEEVAHNEVFFKQDSISGAFSLYSEDRSARIVHSRPATFEECVGLERAAVWDPSHVEDRLRDHFASRPNKWVESLKPRRSG